MAIIDRDGIPGKVCSHCKCWQPTSEFSPKIVRGVPHGDGHQPWCKTCNRERARKAYQADPQKFRERARRYFEKNVEKKRAYDKQRYYANLEQQRERKRLYAREQAQSDPEGRRAKARAWYYKNLEWRRAKNRISRQKHIDAARQRLRRWLKANPEKVAAYQRARRVRRAGGGGSHSEAEWKALKERYDHTCLRCGKQEPAIELTRDHVIPVFNGGSDDIANIQPLCRACNSAKGTQTIDYRPKLLHERRAAYHLRLPPAACLLPRTANCELRCTDAARCVPAACRLPPTQTSPAPPPPRR
jgi:5-methylcytosine-specific restriction endonuclease McrA